MTGFERKGQASSARPLDWATQARLARFSGLCFMKSIAGMRLGQTKRLCRPNFSGDRWGDGQHIVRGKLRLAGLFFVRSHLLSLCSSMCPLRVVLWLMVPQRPFTMQGESSAHGSMGTGSPTHRVFSRRPYLRLGKMQSAGKTVLLLWTGVHLA